MCWVGVKPPQHKLDQREGMAVSREGARERAHLSPLTWQIFDMTSVLHTCNVTVGSLSVLVLSPQKNLNALYVKAELMFSELCGGERSPVWFLAPLCPLPSLISKPHSAQWGSAGLVGAMGRVLKANAGDAKAQEVFPRADKKSDNTQFTEDAVCRL